MRKGKVLSENQRIYRILQEAQNSEEGYSIGFNAGVQSKHYIMGVNIAVSKQKQQFCHVGSDLLDHINVFDKAETEVAYMGQINMIKVSSFCGPEGIIWGYHIFKPKNLYTRYNFIKDVEQSGTRIPVYSVWPLVEALTRLFGTVNNKRFILKPGSHVPCASKVIVAKGKSLIFVALGIGIAEDQNLNANLMMEDVGIIENYDGNFDKELKPEIITCLAKSIVKVGENQGYKFQEIFASTYAISIEKENIGCALVACPYFLVAPDAVPKDLDINNLDDCRLETWEKKILNKKNDFRH